MRERSFRFARTWHLLSIGALLAMALVLFSCKGFFTDPVPTSISISPSSPSVVVGDTQQFSPMALNDDGSTSNITATWTSSSTDIADINLSTGMATAKKAGTTTITATSTGSPTITGTTTMTVTNSALQSITITDSTSGQIFMIGGTDQLTATANYADNSTSTVTTSATWSSNNTGVATVTVNGGLVTGVSAGTVQITATYGNMSANFLVTVQ
jgi:uncharacterized protein YjdB